MLGKELRQEVKTMSSQGANSILKSPNTEHLKEFTWDMILSELSMFALLLKSLLCFATKTRTPRSNTDAVIGMCAAMMFKHRNPNMNLVQRINSLVLYAGQAPKKVMFFHPLNTCIVVLDELPLIYRCMSVYKPSMSHYHPAL
jgi:hypothetical protein